MGYPIPYPQTPPIPQGNGMRATVTFSDANGVPFDPDHGIQIRVVDPLGAETVYTTANGVQKESVGVYWVLVVASRGGDWVFKGTGLLADNTPVTTPDVMQPVIASQVA